MSIVGIAWYIYSHALRFATHVLLAYPVARLAQYMRGLAYGTP